jgi:hypothetical protein
MLVLHSCDVYCCVNPAHLFLGTVVDNIADKVRKGRQKKGMQCPNTAKLTDDDIKEVRYLTQWMSNRAIAKHFGVSSVNIDRIVNGKIWKHI